MLRRRIASLCIGVVCAITAFLAPPARGEQRTELNVIDRRAVDGTVLIIPRVRGGGDPGELPFTAAHRWELEPASRFFRARSNRIPARSFNLDGALPAVTFENGAVRENSPVSGLGGGAKRSFHTGEILRLLEINAAFKSVRMDLEAVCLGSRERRPRGRAVFVLSQQIGKGSLAEANAAVAAELEPIGLREVVRECDPATGLPPFALFPGLPRSAIEETLGEPRQLSSHDGLDVLDYGSFVVYLEGETVVRIAIPALD